MITVKIDSKAVTLMLRNLQQKQLPFATMLGLNDVAFQVQQAERLNMSKVFAHPRPFTQRSVMVTKAKKSSLVATVFIRPEVATYLAPYEVGGTHVVPGKMLLDPIALRLDRYGQLTRTQVANLNAAANDPASGIFLGTVPTQLGPVYGYWQRVGSGMITRKGNLRRLGLRLLAKLEAPGAVNKSLGFEARGAATAQAVAPAAFAKAIATAIATARP